MKSSIGETSYQLGAGMGIALLGSVMNAAYRPGLVGVPGVSAADSAGAAHSLGEAYQIAADLGGAAGAALYAAARESFVHGLHVTLVVSAGLLRAGAVMAWRLPRVMECGGWGGAEPVRLPAQASASAPPVSVPASVERAG